MNVFGYFIPKKVFVIVALIILVILGLSVEEAQDVIINVVKFLSDFN